MSEIINLACGYGGKDSRDLIENTILPILGGADINGNDATVFEVSSKFMAISTDSFVIYPLFFKGGDIGKLAVAGSVNDILARGALPKYLTCSFIIEEGFSLSNFKAILSSMREEADENFCSIITGDTKVVRKGECDGLFINTTALGFLEHNVDIQPSKIQEGDIVIISGTLGDHECSVMLSREDFSVSANIISDCGGLRSLLEPVLKGNFNIKAMRDPTRGGLAATLNEMVLESCKTITIYEDKIPVKDEVKGFCQITGMNYLSMANEGKMIIVIGKEHAMNVLNLLKSHEKGKNAQIIGEVSSCEQNHLIMETLITKKIVPMPYFNQLPRIC